MTAKSDDAELIFADAGQWQGWLADNHRHASEAWLVIARKGFEADGVTIGDALDVALCFGWIDSHRKARDTRSFLQRYSPRRPKTPWSLLNVRRAEALIAAGRMSEAGLAAVRAAQEDGRWASAYASQVEAPMPADIAAALEGDGQAREAYDNLSKSAQYALVLHVLKSASADTRERRIAKAMKGLRESGNAGGVRPSSRG
ncbi:uncharacterized protein YdeI (YjbR/CyaY-like superfamily) [Sphingomonas sp. UYAg733]